VVGINRTSFRGGKRVTQSRKEGRREDQGEKNHLVRKESQSRSPAFPEGKKAQGFPPGLSYQNRALWENKEPYKRGRRKQRGGKEERNTERNRNLKLCTEEGKTSRGTTVRGQRRIGVRCGGGRKGGGG